MIYGIIYGYYAKNGAVAYIGRTINLWSFEITIRIRHIHHLQDGYSPFDVILRKDPNFFDLRILEKIIGDTSLSLKHYLKEREKIIIGELRPLYNIKHCVYNFTR